MKRSANNLNSDQPEMLSKRADKKRVNLPWNHSLFFQVGLIVSLLVVFFIMESSFELKTTHRAPTDTSHLDEPFTLHDFIIEVPEVVKPSFREVIKKPKVNITKPISTVIKVMPNSTATIETNTATTDVTIESNPTKTSVIKTENSMGPKNLLNVEFVPVFPGCESLGTNQEKIDCMSSKIGAFVQRKFRTEQFDYLNSETKHKVYVRFKINANGDITDIKARAANRDLEAEGMRVIGKLPSMKPGRQGDVNVDVLYTVPIVFKVD
jgi:protein TonB